MRPVSQAYREAIQLHRTQGFRNQMHVEISFGLFAEGAKEDSIYMISTGVPFSDDGNMYNETVAVATSYAMWEKDSMRLDNVQRLLPQDGYMPQGYVSAAVAGEDGAFTVPPAVTVSFGQHYSAVGLSFLFDRLTGLCAQEVLVTAYDGANVLKVATAANTENESDFKLELGLDDFDRLLIEFTKAKPFQRVRLNRLLFGIGYIYGNNEVISLEHKREAHPLSLSLPNNQLKITIYNEDNKFDIDSVNSVVRFFQREQRITLRYGYDVSGYGDIEWFSVPPFFLYTWDVSGYKATFTAKDQFYSLTKKIYKKGVFDTAYRKLSVLAKDVLDDAGVENYYITPNDTETQLPLPYVNHAECLQLIANHLCAHLEQDDKGRVLLYRRFLSAESNWEISIRGNTPQLLPYTSIANVATQPAVEYATWEQNRFPVDGGQYLIPHNNDYLNTGVIYNLFPNASGYYRNPPTSDLLIGFRIDLGANISFNSVKIKFSEYSKNSSVRITCDRYPSGTPYAATVSVTMPELTLYEDFTDVRWINIFPASTESKHRLNVLGVQLSLATGLELTLDDMINNPKAELMPAARDLSVQHLGVWYWLYPYSDELMRTNVIPGELTEIKHSDVFYYVTASSDNPNVVFDVQEHYAYTSFVQISGVTGETEIILKGAPYAKLAERYETRHINDDGEDAELINPMVKKQIPAAEMADWAVRYYSNRHQYQIETLGNPECDANDYIRYDNKDVVVLENTITFSQGAMRGKMKLRGGAYGVDDTED